MYYLYIRGASRKHPGNHHWMLLGIFPGSNFWSQSVLLAQKHYGKSNITYRWHSRG